MAATWTISVAAVWLSSQALSFLDGISSTSFCFQCAFTSSFLLRLLSTWLRGCLRAYGGRCSPSTIFRDWADCCLRVISVDCLHRNAQIIGELCKRLLQLVFCCGLWREQLLQSLGKLSIYSILTWNTQYRSLCTLRSCHYHSWVPEMDRRSRHPPWRGIGLVVASIGTMQMDLRKAWTGINLGGFFLHCYHDDHEFIIRNVAVLLGRVPLNYLFIFVLLSMSGGDFEITEGDMLVVLGYLSLKYILEPAANISPSGDVKWVGLIGSSCNCWPDDWPGCQWLYEFTLGWWGRSSLDFNHYRKARVILQTTIPLSPSSRVLGFKTAYSHGTTKESRGVDDILILRNDFNIPTTWLAVSSVVFCSDVDALFRMFSENHWTPYETTLLARIVSIYPKFVIRCRVVQVSPMLNHRIQLEQIENKCRKSSQMR